MKSPNQLSFRVKFSGLTPSTSFTKTKKSNIS